MTKQATKDVNIFDLAVGNIVHFHGARFEIVSTRVAKHGMMRNDFDAERDTVMVAIGKWIDGAVVNGYFGPTKDWTFQGNKRVSHAIEA